SLPRLQKDIEQTGKVNTVLLAERSAQKKTAIARPEQIASVLRDTFKLEDLGIRLRVLDGQRGIALESDSAIISDTLYATAMSAAEKAHASVGPILSYLANSIRAGVREIPYSLVTALDDQSLRELPGPRPLEAAPDPYAGSASSLPPIWLNEWAASDLEARPGALVTIEYYLWKDEGVLSTHTAQFRFVGVVPIRDRAADRDYVPDYPGITATQNIADWDPPFPVDLKRVRPPDEDYWHKYRTTPKAFIPLAAGQELWQSRYGKLTSLRLTVPRDRDQAASLESIKQNLRVTL